MQWARTNQKVSLSTHLPHQNSQRTWAPLGFLAPGLSLLFLFLVIPIVLTVWISIHSWSMLTPISTMPFVGLANYRGIFADPVFLIALRNTWLYSLGNLAILIPLAVLIGVLVFSVQSRVGRIVRVILFLPYVIPNVAVAIVWSYLYQPLYGPLNTILTTFGIPSQNWLGSPREALVALLLMNVWQMIGYYTVIVIAGRTEIPREYYEAASLDGAGTWQAFWRITLPLMKRALTFMIIIVTINSLQIFTPIYILTQGGPDNSTEAVVFHMYNTAFSYLHMGQASAMAFVLFVVILCVSIVELRLLGAFQG